jgi:lysophospholipase L1-like esterase
VQHVIRHSPKTRIVGLALLAALSPACNKLGLGDSSPTGPSSPPAAGSAIVYDALGASDADGVGSSVVCVPFTDCPNGMGYPQIAARQLQSQGFTVSLTNYGIPGSVIGPDFQLLANQFNHVSVANLLDAEVPFVRKNATVVTVFTGANDINVITAALGGGAGASDQVGYIAQQVRAFGVDYQAVIAGIRNRAGASVRIVALNVPNLAALPYLAHASLQQRQAAQLAAVQMTTSVVNPLVSQNVIVVDVMCNAGLYNPANISSDGFHPNDAGYTQIAGEVVRAITSASYPAPQSSCSLMNAVPNP